MGFLLKDVLGLTVGSIDRCLDGTNDRLNVSLRKIDGIKDGIVDGGTVPVGLALEETLGETLGPFEGSSTAHRLKGSTMARTKACRSTTGKSWAFPLQ